MGSISPELSLDFKPTKKTKTISGFLRETSQIEDVSEKKLKFDEYVKRLDEEMKKIDAFKRELPLCMLLLNDAIVGLKEEAMQFNVVQSVRNSEEGVKSGQDSKDKKNWMSSAQLWSSNGDSFVDDKKSVEKMKEVTENNNPYSECKFWKSEGAFTPFNGFSGFPATMKEDKEIRILPVLSPINPGIDQTEPIFGSWNSKNIFSSKGNVQQNLQTAATPQQQQQEQSQKKQRRCWSPELHRRFVSALQQLGGSQVATPKQIRELMKVDGLTNDEVKSHLQKYRLHIRRVPTASTPENNSVVLLGGVWVPQDQFEASKPTKLESGSPQGPLQLGGPAGGISSTGGNSMEDEEDRKSVSYGWKDPHKPGESEVLVDQP